nr:GGDEF domain-containing protein [Micromonospora sp. DSM 115978]
LPRTRDVGQLLLPYAPFAAVVCLAVYAVVRGNRVTRIELGIGTGVVCLVLLRQFVTLVQNRQLLVRVRAGEQKMRYLAFHDPLTGLANRALLDASLERATRSCHPPDGGTPTGASRGLALMFCDLDDFKYVNDTLGHAAGDVLLREVAGRLRASVRVEDVV